ncbi:MAG: HAD-IA family hydrolase [Promethearchaeota archaeon]
MKENSIKTIVLDLGGVYFTSGTVLAIKKIKELFGIKNYSLLKKFFNDYPNTEGNLIRRGLITLKEFEENLVLKLKINEDDLYHLKQIWFGSYLPNYLMEELVKKLKEQKNYRLVVFSGNIRERIDFLEKRYGFSKYFDDFVYSFDYKKNKDDRGFYEELIQHIKCEPNEAILVDDLLKVIKMAESLGFIGINYLYTKQLINEFKRYNIIINL